MDIIDRNQLTECLTGELDLDRDLMQSAINEIENRRSDMQQALTNQDYEAWRSHAHRSVGTTSTLGFLALAAEFRIAELHTSNDPERADLLDRIHALIEGTRQTLVEIGLL